MPADKPVNTVVLDTGAIIKNEPPVSTLISQAEVLVTVPAILSEIKDAATRSRVETTLRPFLTLRSPNASSIAVVTDFARRTGDLAVLSQPDIQIIALAYEIECERNGGDWRLRRVPGQKGLNGAPPKRDAPVDEAASQEPKTIEDEHQETVRAGVTAGDASLAESAAKSSADVARVTEELQETSLADANEPAPEDDAWSKVDSARNSAESHECDSDSDGWITPANLKEKQAQDAGASTTHTPEPRTMQVGVLTSDFAMQNVILQMNLNLLSPAMSRVKQLKTYVLRCHACFHVSRDLGKQFCPRCGQPSLTRVSCSTDANGQFRLHLKKNMQWNNRGNKFSVPKPVHGSANGRVRGGGKHGWGHELILAEDQKEYQDAARREKRRKEKSLMDEDYLPSILTGDRGKSGGRPKVGAGRNVNSRKR